MDSASPPIRVLPLGAGQDVGKSCVIVTVGNFSIMFDCGMHMGYNDERRFPNFSGISLAAIDCVVITHFHLDHCGALPYLVGRLGYTGPVYMTHPTRAICPILLTDYHRIHKERRVKNTADYSGDFFLEDDIKLCIRHSTGVSLHETIQVKPGLTLKAYYAGHVLGAAMFLARAHHDKYSVVYTGDFNTTPDRHLRAAWIDECRPDLMITESTYATTVRDSRRHRETQLLRRILACVKNNGKVLIPVFALGRAQELCILLDTTWRRLKLTVPVYFSAGLTEKANACYRLFIPWTNEAIQREHTQGRNPFQFSFVKPWQSGYATLPGATVLFATPGMLHQGVALDMFRRWAPDANNIIILPGYCVRNTVGYRVLNAQYAKTADRDPTARMIEVGGPRDVVLLRATVENLSFSAHADATGIMQMLKMAQPRAVMLVHGERSKMEVLKRQVEQELRVTCVMPPNGTVVEIPVQPRVAVVMPLLKMLRRAAYAAQARADESDAMVVDDDPPPPPPTGQPSTTIQEMDIPGVLTREHLGDDDVWRFEPTPLLNLQFKMSVRYTPRVGCCATDSDTPWRDPDAFKSALDRVMTAFQREFGHAHRVVRMVDTNMIVVDDVVRLVDVEGEGRMEVTWDGSAEALAGRVLETLDVALS